MSHCITITPNMLSKALERILREESAGLIDMEIVEVIVTADDGAVFNPAQVEVVLANRKPVGSEAKADKAGRFTAPAGVGKIRLATVDGVQA